MNAIPRLNYLSSQMELEPAEDTFCHQPSSRRHDAVYVSRAILPNGKYISLLKTLLTSACERNCYYCAFRAGRNYKRVTLSPSEMAKAFITYYHAGIVEGLFLSSGIAGGGHFTQDKLNETAEILRNKHKFTGYLHLKLMPGAQFAHVEHAMKFADRLSLNLEAPNTKRLHRLAPRKLFIEELVKPLHWIESIRRSQPSYLGWKGHWPSTSTQFVVGAAGESDLELLTTTSKLNSEANLARAYYSAFRPVANTPLEASPATPTIRQSHLYQASYLLRDYGYTLTELPFTECGNLPEYSDPKTAWADLHLSEAPVEINSAKRRDLLRVPGIGPKGVQSILSARRKGCIRYPEELRKLGISPDRAMPYILLNGRKSAKQLTYW